MNTDTWTSLPSEKVVIESPMSFAGSAKRIWHITKGRSGWVSALTVTGAVIAVSMAWMVIASWYMMFGLMVVPWRVLRRGHRRNKRDSRRHRETIAALSRR